MDYFFLFSGSVERAVIIAMPTQNTMHENDKRYSSRGYRKRLVIPDIHAVEYRRQSQHKRTQKKAFTFA